MKELELLKKDWQKQKNDASRFTFNDISKMILKKSSSIVRWIFIISIVEFLLWHLLYLIPNNNLDVYKALDMMWFIYLTTVLHYAITFVFIYFFYRNFKRISNTDTTKRLMENIINTRKTVRYYVFYNLAAFAIIYLIANLIMYSKKDILFQIDSIKAQLDAVPQLKEIFFLVQGISGIIMILIVGGIYYLIYGLMLRKLKRNYNELKELHT